MSWEAALTRDFPAVGLGLSGGMPEEIPAGGVEQRVENEVTSKL